MVTKKKIIKRRRRALVVYMTKPNLKSCSKSTVKTVIVQGFDIKIQTLSTHLHPDGNVLVHKAFLELHNNTTLQHSPNNWSTLELVLKHEKYEEHQIKIIKPYSS